jgi:hypothetical protein
MPTCRRCKKVRDLTDFKRKRMGPERNKCCQQCLTRVECELCPSKFCTLGQLNSHHRAVHEKIRDKPCLRCGALFKTVGNMKMHMREAAYCLSEINIRRLEADSSE